MSIKTTTSIRVFDCHIDGNGHVSSSQFGDFLRCGRLDFWLAHDKEWFDERKITIHLKEENTKFERPCFMLDVLSIECEWLSLENGEAWVKQTIKKQNGKLAVASQCRLSFISIETGRSLPLSDEILAKLRGE